MTFEHIYTPIASVSHFSLAFQKALDSSRQSQTELADAINISVAQVNRYARGRSDLRADVLVRILDAFPEELAGQLLKAYLLDQCPPTKSHLVSIDCASTTLQEPTPDILAGFPPDVVRVVRYLASRCSDQVVLDFLSDFARLLQGDVISTSDTATLPVDQIAADERTRRAQAKRSSQAQNA